MRGRTRQLRPRRATPASPYRGAGGFSETYFLAELDRDQQVIRREPGNYRTQLEALLAWTKCRDRRLRLVRDVVFREVVA